MVAEAPGSGDCPRDFTHIPAHQLRGWSVGWLTMSLLFPPFSLSVSFSTSLVCLSCTYPFTHIVEYTQCSSDVPLGHVVDTAGFMHRMCPARPLAQAVTQLVERVLGQASCLGLTDSCLLCHQAICLSLMSNVITW